MFSPLNRLCCCLHLDQQSFSVSFSLYPICRATATKVITSGNEMSGSQWLGLACPSKYYWKYMLVCSISRWKISVKYNINTDSGELSLLMCGASLFFTPFVGLTIWWIFVFFPWGGPRVGNLPLVAACGSTSAESCCFVVVVTLLLPQNRQHCEPQHLIPT